MYVNTHSAMKPIAKKRKIMNSFYILNTTVHTFFFSFIILDFTNGGVNMWIGMLSTGCSSKIHVLIQYMGDKVYDTFCANVHP
jgi:hypothetical protein